MKMYDEDGRKESHRKRRVNNFKNVELIKFDASHVWMKNAGVALAECERRARKRQEDVMLLALLIELPLLFLQPSRGDREWEDNSIRVPNSFCLFLFRRCQLISFIFVLLLIRVCGLPCSCLLLYFFLYRSTHLINK